LQDRLSATKKKLQTVNDEFLSHKIEYGREIALKSQSVPITTAALLIAIERV